MTKLELFLLLELFTIRFRKQYDFGLFVRVRKHILTIYDDLCSNNVIIFSDFNDVFIEKIQRCSLSLDLDEYGLINHFIKYIRLTKEK